MSGAYLARFSGAPETFPKNKKPRVSAGLCGRHAYVSDGTGFEAESGRAPASILLYDLNLQIIERNLFHKAILPEAGFGMPLKFADIAVKPERFPKVKAQTDLVERAKDLMRPRILALIDDDGILKQMIFLPDFCP